MLLENVTLDLVDQDSGNTNTSTGSIVAQHYVRHVFVFGINDDCESSSGLFDMSNLSNKRALVRGFHHKDGSKDVIWIT